MLLNPDPHQGLRPAFATNTSRKTGHVPVVHYHNPELLGRLRVARERMKRTDA